MTATRHKHLEPALVCALLVLATLAVYWPVRRHGFINYDDHSYVTENQHVSKGLTWEGVGWAFGRLHGEQTYWHPLTWVSHMVDCQLFGLKPAGHHLMNVLFHLLNTMLVFLVFRRMTGALWRCAVLAGLFALHPLQVDTVAWVAERKNLLSTFFGLLAIWAYAEYARDTKGQTLRAKDQGPKSVVSGQWSGVSGCSSILQLPSSRFYFLSLVLFAVSLMCKPALVTLPFVLLLLDYWPLRLFSLPTLRRPPAPPLHPVPRSITPLFHLVLEKLPFFVLSAASSAITILAHRGLGMLEATAGLGLEFRLESALVSYGGYLGNAFWPSKLAVLYPLPPAWPTRTVAFSGLLLLGVSALAIAKMRSRPYLLVGWLWFLGTLVPFVGLIQVGAQAMADRFAYLPLVGLFLALVWTVAELTQRQAHRSRIVPCMAILLLLTCAMLSRRQVGYWRDSITLFERALAVTTGNAMAHACLGTEFVNLNRETDALAEFWRALTLKPVFATPLSGMAEAFCTEGRLELAAAVFRQILEVTPNDATTHYRLGSVVARQGKLDEAIGHYEAALRLAPDWPEVLNNFAWLLATHPNARAHDGARAVPLAERACQLTGSTNLWLLSTLAAAYAKAGRYPEAVTTQRKACELAAAKGQSGPTESFRSRLELYRSGQPYRVSAPNP